MRCPAGTPVTLRDCAGQNVASAAAAAAGALRTAGAGPMGGARRSTLLCSRRPDRLGVRHVPMPSTAICARRLSR